MLYIIDMEGAPFFKLGYSGHPTSVEGRLRALQPGNPKQLKVLLVVEGEWEIEQRLHRLLRALNVHAPRGEWFIWTPVTREMAELLKTRGWRAALSRLSKLLADKYPLGHR
jgi:hypothetical protein